MVLFIGYSIQERARPWFSSVASVTSVVRIPVALRQAQGDKPELLLAGSTLGGTAVDEQDFAVDEGAGD